jgi:hypothetical protein
VSFTANPILSGGTANGVLFLNGSKVATSGSALTFDGTNLGVGATPTSYNAAADNLVLYSALNTGLTIASGTTNDGSIFFARGTSGADAYKGFIQYYHASDNLAFGVNATEAMRLTSTTLYTASGINVGIGTSSPAGKLHVSGQTRIADSANAANYILIGAGANAPRGGNSLTAQTGSLVFATESANPMIFVTNAVEAARLDSSGNLLIGQTTNTQNYRLVIKGSAGTADDLAFNSDATRAEIQSFNSKPLELNRQGNNVLIGSAGSGNLGIGTSSPVARLDVQSSTFGGRNARFIDNSGVGSGGRGSGISLGGISNDTGPVITEYVRLVGLKTNATQGNTQGYLTFEIDGGSGLVERARITDGGALLVGKTSTGDYVTGVELQSAGAVLAYRTNDLSAIFGRTNDGVIVRFTAASTIVGDISVSGGTVSYNAFAGSHWSQLQNGSRPDILRGTVMESINELCVWPGENNERLPKSKISDTVGSKKVYGVFMAWDNDWSETNDMYVTSVGAFICRVNGSVTVQEGDLLESNGDGTARVQADDIIRSSTIGKVTSTVKTHEYADGSYCVPTVLYCG